MANDFRQGLWHLKRWLDQHQVPPEGFALHLSFTDEEQYVKFLQAFSGVLGPNAPKILVDDLTLEGLKVFLVGPFQVLS